jgi:phage regulator Rha-like protein
MNKHHLLPTQTFIEQRILCIRGEKIMLDSDLADLYGVSTKALIKAVKRNRKRFPDDFLFQLTSQEITQFKSQFAISTKSHGGRRYLPYAFTEHGAIMAANVLRSSQAIEASIAVIRAFVKLRRILASHKQLTVKVLDLEHAIASHDKAICSLFDAIRKLMMPAKKERKRIGFIDDSEIKTKKTD